MTCLLLIYGSGFFTFFSIFDNYLFFIFCVFNCKFSWARNSDVVRTVIGDFLTPEILLVGFYIFLRFLCELDLGDLDWPLLIAFLF